MLFTNKGVGHFQFYSGSQLPLIFICGNGFEYCPIVLLIWLIDWYLVFNATFSNISATSWRPVLVVKEAGVPGENHRPWASNWLTLSLAAACTYFNFCVYSNSKVDFLLSLEKHLYLIFSGQKARLYKRMTIVTYKICIYTVHIIKHYQVILMLKIR